MMKYIKTWKLGGNLSKNNPRVYFQDADGPNLETKVQAAPKMTKRAFGV